MISESKVEDLFPDGQFFFEGFGTPFFVEIEIEMVGVLYFSLEITFLHFSKLFLQMKGLLKVFM